MRLFVAADLPEDVRANLAEWARPHAANLRAIPAESLHITLAFLGHLPEAPDLPQPTTEAPGLSLDEPLWLPKRRPGVLAVGLKDHARALNEIIEELGFPREKRPYRPHVTVARVPRGVRPPRATPPAPEPITFTVPSITLYRSHTSPKGARYEPLVRHGLPSPI
jgi:RNA 2',3'-cyclic 3'-phosphodiesterase